jgi:hypothetical protein
VVGRGDVVLSAEEPRSIVSSIPKVPAAGRSVEIRGLNRAALEQAAKKTYSLDSKFWRYFVKE